MLETDTTKHAFQSVPGQPVPTSYILLGGGRKEGRKKGKTKKKTHHTKKNPNKKQIKNPQTNKTKQTAQHAFTGQL